jgi:hypothetical protein
LRLSDLSAFNLSDFNLSDFNLSSSRHWGWLTTKLSEDCEQLSKPDPRPHLTGFPPEPKEKKCFL